MDHFGLAAGIREVVKHPIECLIDDEYRWQISSENFLKEMWSEEAHQFGGDGGYATARDGKGAEMVFGLQGVWVIPWTTFQFLKTGTKLWERVIISK